jgi:hypothetical protein
LLNTADNPVMSEEPQAPTGASLKPLLLVDGEIWRRLDSMIQQLCVGLVDAAARLHVLHEARAELGELLGPAVVATLPAWRLRRRKRLVEWIKGVPNLNANVVHVMGSRLMWVGQALHGLLNIPVAAHISSAEDIWAARRHLRVEGLRVMAISEPLRELCLKKLRLREDRVHLVRPGMRSVEKQRVSTGDRGMLTVFVWAQGKSGKSIDVVFRALHKLLTDGRQIMAFVIGAEEGEGRLRSMANAMGLDARVTFLPEPRLISLGAGGEDVLILPQPPAQLALQTLGALAAGVVVVAAGPGLHDCLRDGETALMYPAGDPGQLALQLDRLLENRPLARRLADQGRAYVADHHRVSTMVKRVVEVYEQVLAEHAAKRKPATAKTIAES